MRFIIQRVSKAKVDVDNLTVGKIENGFLVLIGITHDDTIEIADRMIRKMLNLRIFSDQNGKMNLPLKDVGGKLLLVSQFTLYANCRRGNRPDFMQSANPEKANELYGYIIEECRKCGVTVETGIFGADMKVELLNDGPVTIILDSNDIM